MGLIASASLFLSAFLLFGVQPLWGKLLLPHLGGTPDVWASCLLFFQLMCLGGYLYADIVRQIANPLWERLIHFSALLLALFVTISASRSGLQTLTHNQTLRGLPPAAWVLFTLGYNIGAPVFILAATSPLVQKWFSETTHPRAGNPYFLYTASNLGSLIALVCYPFLIEPWIGLTHQRMAWGWGLVLFSLLLTAAASLTKRSRVPHAKRGQLAPLRTDLVNLKNKLSWLIWAFLPSSLLLGTTTYISTDIAPIPLLWVLPLAIYLVSFIIAIDLKESHLGRVKRLFLFFSLLVLIGVMNPGAYPGPLMIAVHLLYFGFAATVCHGILMTLRPTPTRLTSFYFYMALGGALGGIFNNLLAPYLFSVPLEYPLVILLTLATVVGIAKKNAAPNILKELGVFSVIILIATCSRIAGGYFLQSPKLVQNFIMMAIPSLICLKLIEKNELYRAALIGLFAASLIPTDSSKSTVYQERNFFGSLRILKTENPKSYVLLNGTIMHGIISRTDAPNTSLLSSPEPQAYYCVTGPAGDIFQTLPSTAQVGVVGLGIGTLATYAKPEQRWTFFEINPLVVQLAQSSQYFNYLSTSKAKSLHIQLGDARLRLTEEGDHQYDLLVIDAFGSDAIPFHLLTREAFELYWQKIKPNGALLIHISNSYLNLKRPIAELARETQSTAWVRTDSFSRRGLHLPSRWVFLTKDSAQVHWYTENTAIGKTWTPLLATGVDANQWTDDYSNILSLLISRHF